MERFFDVVPSNFFNVLSRKNKNLYADCIINLYKAIVNESNMLITKTNAYSIMDQIMSYYSETGELEEFDVPYADTIRMLEKPSISARNSFETCFWRKRLTPILMR